MARHAWERAHTDVKPSILIHSKMSNTVHDYMATPVPSPEAVCKKRLAESDMQLSHEAKRMNNPSVLQRAETQANVREQMVKSLVQIPEPFH